MPSPAGSTPKARSPLTLRSASGPAAMQTSCGTKPARSPSRPRQQAAMRNAHPPCCSDACWCCACARWSGGADAAAGVRGVDPQAEWLLRMRSSRDPGRYVIDITLRGFRSGAAVTDISCSRVARGCVAASGTATLTRPCKSCHEGSGGSSVGERLSLDWLGWDVCFHGLRWIDACSSCDLRRPFWHLVYPSFCWRRWCL